MVKGSYVSLWLSIMQLDISVIITKSKYRSQVLDDTGCKIRVLALSVAPNPPQVLAYPVFSKITNLFWTCFFESHLINRLTNYVSEHENVKYYFFIN
jgi:hypothetical protein